jgi:hypothetical protein
MSQNLVYDNFYFLCKLLILRRLTFRNEISGLRSSSIENALPMNIEVLFHPSLPAPEQSYFKRMD